MNPSSEREAFEAEYLLMFPVSSTVPGKFEQNGIGGYEDFQVNNAWRFWQARAALSHPSTPQGWKLVPVEPTPEMIEEAASFGGRGGYSKQWGDEAVSSYKDMLAAAPPPPEQGSKG